MHSLWRDEEGSARPGDDPGAELNLWDEKDTVATETQMHPDLDEIWAPPAERPQEKPAALPAPTTDKRSPRREQEQLPKPRPLRRALGAFVYMLVILFLLTLADAAYVGWRINSDLTAGSKLLSAGMRDLKDGDHVNAGTKIEKALQRIGSAKVALKHPASRIASVFSLTSGDTRAIAALTDAAGASAASAAKIVEVMEQLGVSGEDISSAIYENGQVNVTALKEVGPQMSEVSEGLLLASGSLNELEESPSLAVVTKALDDAKAQLADAIELTERAGYLFDILPPALGAEGDRRYLLLFQALGESRGTGGVAGLYGVLNATEGRLDLEKIEPYSKLGPTRATDVPPWFEEGYSFQSALTQWPQANVSPNFPAVAQAMLSMYENSTGEQLDGALAMDPITLARLVRGTGPIKVGGEKLGPDEIANLLLVDSYTEFPDQKKQNDLLERVVERFWSQVTASPDDPKAFLTAFGESIDQQHLKFYLKEEQEQEALGALGATGYYAAEGDMVQMLFTNNYSVNKVDYFLERSTETDVLILPDGTAKVEVRVTLDNEAPTGFPDLLLGPGTDSLPPGGNASLVSLLMPTDSIPTSTSVNGERVSVLSYKDQDHPVSWAFVGIPPQNSASLTFKYDIPGAVRFDQGGAFTFTLFPQATVRPEQFEIDVTAAANMSGDPLVSSRRTQSGDLLVPRNVDIAFSAK